MLRLTNLSNKYQKRTLRVLYGQTQAYPYAAVLDSSFRDVDGSITMDGTTIVGSSNPPRTAPAALYKGGLVPGMVMTLMPGTDAAKVGVGDAALDGEQPFGLLANFVGGQLDECGDENEIGIWRSGQGGVLELLAPAFATVSVAGANSGIPTPLYCGTDGRLTSTAPAVAGAPAVVVANLLAKVGAARIVVDLKV
jgi:hypothetical protein